MRIMTANFTGHARVGVLDGEQSGDPESKASLAQIAAYNEHGTATIPPRPAMRRTIDTHSQKYEQMMGEGFGRLLDRRMTEKQILTELGVEGVKDMKRMYTSARTWAEPNALRTVRQKRSSTPLIDTGTLRNSISFDVATGRGSGGVGST